MCGIVYFRRFDGKPVLNSILKRYEAQKTRGSDGFGFVSIYEDKIKRFRRTTEEEIKQELNKETASEILFHHRWPTSTANLSEAAHPIRIRNSKILEYDYYLVHNGIITDAEKLKAEHEKLGFVYETSIKTKFFTCFSTYSESSFNDSEALGIELALFVEGKKDKLDFTGPASFILLQIKNKKPIKLYFGRNAGNPLVINLQKKQFFSLTSEGSGQILGPDILYCLDYKTNEITETPVKLGNYTAAWFSTFNWKDYEDIDTPISSQDNFGFTHISSSVENRKQKIQERQFNEEIQELNEHLEALEIAYTKAQVMGDIESILTLEDSINETKAEIIYLENQYVKL